VKEEKIDVESDPENENEEEEQLTRHNETPGESECNSILSSDQGEENLTSKPLLDVFRL
jgi:hypothetical protein